MRVLNLNLYRNKYVGAGKHLLRIMVQVSGLGRISQVISLTRGEKRERDMRSYSNAIV
jgi:hypothetical protein